MLEVAWWWYAASGEPTSRWLLEPSPGIRLAAAAYILAGCAVVALRRVFETWLVELAALWLGSILTASCLLLVVGPGNLYGVVVVIDAALLGGFLAVGSLLGLLVRLVLGILVRRRAFRRTDAMMRDRRR